MWEYLLKLLDLIDDPIRDAFIHAAHSFNQVMPSLHEWGEGYFGKLIWSNIVEGWRDCGSYLVQACIGILVFSASVQRFRECIIEPNLKTLKNDRDEAYSLAFAEDTQQPGVGKVHDMFWKETEAIAKQYEAKCSIILQKGHFYCVMGGLLAVLLTVINLHQYIGIGVLVTLWPLLIMQVMSIRTYSWAREGISKCTERSKEMQEVLRLDMDKPAKRLITDKEKLKKMKESKSSSTSKSSHETKEISELSSTANVLPESAEEKPLNCAIQNAPETQGDLSHTIGRATPLIETSQS